MHDRKYPDASRPGQVNYCVRKAVNELSAHGIENYATSLWMIEDRLDRPVNCGQKSRAQFCAIGLVELGCFNQLSFGHLVETEPFPHLSLE
jgi:hypothetical protein